jgi:ubiquinone/menaquinone biosynthesis C-methylase UbiE
MRRFDAPEILDSATFPPCDAPAVLAVLGRVNRWFGGVSTSHKMLDRVARTSELNRLSLLEVAAGLGEVPEIIRQRLAQRGVALDVTLLDMAHSHLPAGVASTAKRSRTHSVVADALSLPFADKSFDIVGCSLFAHHLDPDQLQKFVGEALRVSRRAVLINDLVRDPLHLALAYISYPIMRNRVAWLDGLTSVRRAYVPREIQHIIASKHPLPALSVEISRNYLYRMGVIVWNP